MLVVALITVATGAVLLWALYAEQVPPPPHLQARRWAGLPSSDDIQRRDFPLTVAGYDPDAVDAHLRRLSVAFAALRTQLTAPGPVPDTPAATPLPPTEPTTMPGPAVPPPMPPPDPHAKSAPFVPPPMPPPASSTDQTPGEVEGPRRPDVLGGRDADA